MAKDQAKSSRSSQRSVPYALSGRGRSSVPTSGTSSQGARTSRWVIWFEDDHDAEDGSFTDTTVDTPAGYEGSWQQSIVGNLARHVMPGGEYRIPWRLGAPMGQAEQARLSDILNDKISSFSRHTSFAGLEVLDEEFQYTDDPDTYQRIHGYNITVDLTL